jgi:hypothetical protein
MDFVAAGCSKYSEYSPDEDKFAALRIPYPAAWRRRMVFEGISLA